MIREYRIKKRLRAKEVAEKLGIKLRDYLDIEYNQRECTLSEHMKLLIILGIYK